MNAIPEHISEDDDTADQDAPFFVGRTLEFKQVSSALLNGSSVVIKARPGMGKRTLLAQVRAGMPDDRVCLHPSVSTPKQMCADLAEQIHLAFGLKIPERLIPPRFRSKAEKTGYVDYRHIKRSLGRLPVADQRALILASLKSRNDVILFVDSLEIPPTQAELLSEIAEHCQLAACMEDSNRRTRIQRLLWSFQKTIELKPLIRPEVCECCGEPGELLAHHESYAPENHLLVGFLLRKCHARVHGEGTQNHGGQIR